MTRGEHALIKELAGDRPVATYIRDKAMGR